MSRPTGFKLKKLECQTHAGHLMFKGLPRPIKHLPLSPYAGKRKHRKKTHLNPFTLPFKVIVGVSFLGFLLNYQPSLGFPPVKTNIAHAQIAESVPEVAEQTQTVSSRAIPIIFHWPNYGVITTYFSWVHPGIDIATSFGTPIHPSADGVVVFAGWDNTGYGNTVLINHVQGYQTRYAHMDKIYVHVGQTVSQSDVVGDIGVTGRTTGPHNHFEIHHDGTPVNPLPLLE